MSRIQPLTNAKDEIEAMALNILGLKFMLLLGPLDPAKFPLLHHARHRPGRIVVSYPASTHWITMSWEDGKVHEHLTVQFVRPVPKTHA
jgi:hypothetical protein